MFDLVGTTPSLLFGVCALACPLGMGAMMWFMMRAKNRPEMEQRRESELSPDHSDREEIVRLRHEVNELRSRQAESSPGTG